jgi:hypothetical protein
MTRAVTLTRGAVFDAFAASGFNFREFTLPTNIASGSTGDALAFIARRYPLTQGVLQVKDMILSINNSRRLRSDKSLVGIEGPLFLSPNSQKSGLVGANGLPRPYGGAPTDAECNRAPVTFAAGSNDNIIDPNIYSWAEWNPNNNGNYIPNVTCNEFLGTFASQATSGGSVATWLSKVGCTSAAACTFDGTVLLKDEQGTSCVYHGAGTAPNGTYYSLGWFDNCKIRFDCTKTAWDPAFIPTCCNQIGGDDARCDPLWCIDDPESQCLPTMLSSCTGLPANPFTSQTTAGIKGMSSCGRHNFLTPDTASTNNMACNEYWLATHDMFLEYVLKGGKPDEVSAQALNKAEAMMAEVHRYCIGDGRASAEGAASGECSCYNGYVNCQGAQSLSGACLMHVPDPTNKGAARRVDAYCSGDTIPPLYSSFSSVSSSGVTEWLPGPCGNALPSYATPTVNSDSPNPWGGGSGSGSGVGGFPLHCWLPECQTNGETCVFKNMVDFLKPCPSICFQYSSGANITIGNINSPNKSTEVDVTQVSCDFGGKERNALISPYSVPEDCMYLSLQMPQNMRGTISLPLFNLGQDALHSFSSITYAAYSSVSPLISILPADQRGFISSMGSTTVHVMVDSAGQEPYTTINGFLNFQDPTGANGQFYVPLEIAILGPDSSQGGTPVASSGVPFTCDPNFGSTLGPSPSQILQNTNRSVRSMQRIADAENEGAATMQQKASKKLKESAIVSMAIGLVLFLVAVVWMHKKIRKN